MESALPARRRVGAHPPIRSRDVFGCRRARHAQVARGQGRKGAGAARLVASPGETYVKYFPADHFYTTRTCWLALLGAGARLAAGANPVLATVARLREHSSCARAPFKDADGSRQCCNLYLGTPSAEIGSTVTTTRVASSLNAARRRQAAMVAAMVAAVAAAAMVVAAVVVVSVAAAAAAAAVAAAAAALAAAAAAAAAAVAAAAAAAAAACSTSPCLVWPRWRWSAWPITGCARCGRKITYVARTRVVLRALDAHLLRVQLRLG